MVDTIIVTTLLATLEPVGENYALYVGGSYQGEISKAAGGWKARFDDVAAFATPEEAGMQLLKNHGFVSADDEAEAEASSIG